MPRYKSIKFDMLNDAQAQAYKKICEISDSVDLSIRQVIVSIIESVDSLNLVVDVNFEEELLKEKLLNGKIKKKAIKEVIEDKQLDGTIEKEKINLVLEKTQEDKKNYPPEETEIKERSIDKLLNLSKSTDIPPERNKILSNL